MSNWVTTLGTAERDRQWVSTLTGARYRWASWRWECRHKSATYWYPVNAVREPKVVYAYGGERFEEVADA